MRASSFSTIVVVLLGGGKEGLSGAVRLSQISNKGSLCKIWEGELAMTPDLVVEDYRFRKLRSVDEVIWRANKNLRPSIGKMLAFKFGARDMKLYVETRREAGASDATVNRELAIVRGGFTLGFQAEPQELLAELPERLKALFGCAYHVGTQKGELRLLGGSRLILKPRTSDSPRRRRKGSDPGRCQSTATWSLGLNLGLRDVRRIVCVCSTIMDARLGRSSQGDVRRAKRAGCLACCSTICGAAR